VRLLLTQPAFDIHHKNAEGENSFHCLCINNLLNGIHSVAVVRLLIDHGIDLNAKTKNRVDTALHYFCRNSCYCSSDLLEFFIIENGMDIHTRDSIKGDSILHHICRGPLSRRSTLGSSHYCSSNLLDLIAIIVEAGIDVNLKTVKRKQTALHLLCCSQKYPCLQSEEILNFFIVNGIDVQAKDDSGDNALHVICRHCQSDKILELITALVDSGIDVKVTTTDGSSALNLLWKRQNNQQQQNNVNLLPYLVNCQ